MTSSNDSTATTNETDTCNIVELRQYTLHPHQRDTLITLFDREFVETQEAVGMRVLGQFRDLDDANRFVWLRGFADMEARRHGLEAFYGGPVWAAHRSTANATMISSDDVLLLRPAWPGAADALYAGERAEPGSTRVPRGIILVAIHYLQSPADTDLLDWCHTTMAPALIEGAAVRQAWYVTEPSLNNFPRLSVRSDVTVLVGVAVFPNTTALENFQHSPYANGTIPLTLAKRLAKPPELHGLAPTARSALHL